MARPWRVARSLLVLRAEVDAWRPKRDRASDGTIGDATHASRNSDHNPWVIDDNGIGVVRALDVDAGPGLNPDEAHDTVGDRVARVAVAAGASGHPAMGPGAYVIWDRRIASAASSPPWTWRPYLGSDPHTSHPHISVTTRGGNGLTGYDNPKPWGVAPVPRPKPVPEPVDRRHKPGSRVLRQGMKGTDVQVLRRFLLGVSRPTSQPFGQRLDRAVRRYQRMRGLKVDGVVGAATWRPILRAMEGDK